MVYNGYCKGDGKYEEIICQLYKRRKGFIKANI